MGKRAVRPGVELRQHAARFNRSELRTLKQQGVVGKVKARMDAEFMAGLRAALEELYSHPGGVRNEVYVNRPILVAKIESDPQDYADFMALLGKGEP